MNKFIIPALLSSAALIGSAILFVSSSNTKTAADEYTEVPEVKTGVYYLNGDKESDIYIDVTEKSIKLVCEELDGYFLKDMLTDYDSNEMTDEIMTELQACADDLSKEYTADNEYVVSIVGLEEVPYAVLINWDKSYMAEDNRYGGSGYFFNGTDTLTMWPMGDFILS